MRNKKALKIVASIEARMTSSRLPGKVLMLADGKPLLQHMVERIRKAKLVDDIVVATTVNATDLPIVELCQQLGIKVFRGSEEDVLQRVLDAQASVNSDVIVELTGDCPLIDPEVIDQIVQEYLDSDADYVSNAHVRSYPDGYDVQAFGFNVLKEVSAKTQSKEDREHVSLYIYKSGEYSLKAVIAEEEIRWPELRITLDNKGDYLLIKNILETSAQEGKEYNVREVVQYMRQHPELLELQKDSVFNEIEFQKHFSQNK